MAGVGYVAYLVSTESLLGAFAVVAAGVGWASTVHFIGEFESEKRARLALLETLERERAARAQ